MAPRIGRGDTGGYGTVSAGSGTGNSMGPRERVRLFGHYRLQWSGRP